MDRTRAQRGLRTKSNNQSSKKNGVKAKKRKTKTEDAGLDEDVGLYGKHKEEAKQRE